MFFPFGAIVGNKDLKRALLICMVNPRVGGVLIEGEKGTGKSTIIRAMADILPQRFVYKGCLFNLGPEDAYFCKECGVCGQKIDFLVKTNTKIITLPLNATEDMVVGGIDIEHTLKSGKLCFQPGLLSKAHEGILYIDEVNLLQDNIVDLILDVMESGTNIVQREGFSISHPARFVLIASMNPEEGHLRPQFIDRFGLCVKIKGLKDPKLRMETVLRREAFDRDPKKFYNLFKSINKEYLARIKKAKQILPYVTISQKLRILISNLCTKANCAGHRSDIVFESAAKAIAALEFRKEVKEQDILEIAPFVLEHRKREKVPPQKHTKKQTPPKDLGDSKSPSKGKGEKNHNNHQKQQNKETSHGIEGESNTGQKKAKKGVKTKPKEDIIEKIFKIGETFKPKNLLPYKDRKFRIGSGRRALSKSMARQGRYIKAKITYSPNDVAIDATIRASAPYQKNRRKYKKDLAIIINPEDVREKIRQKKIGSMILFLVDTSGSMGVRERMSAVKGAIMSLLLDAYQKRDKVAMIIFNKNNAKLILPPTSSVELAGRYLSELPVGGKTPLSSGLYKTYCFLTSQKIKDPILKKIVLIITDGRANVPLGYMDDPVEESMNFAKKLEAEFKDTKFIVVDTEKNGFMDFGIAKELSNYLKADYLKIKDLKAQNLLNITSEELR